jgi:hypothetical protein
MLLLSIYWSINNADDVTRMRKLVVAVFLLNRLEMMNARIVRYCDKRAPLERREARQTLASRYSGVKRGVASRLPDSAHGLVGRTSTRIQFHQHAVNVALR